MYYLEILKQLEKNHFRTFDFVNAQTILSREKKELKEKKDSGQLKIIWFVQIALQVINLYNDTFDQLRKRKYHEAWNNLERIEININNIKFNDFDITNYWILQYIEIYIEKFQQLYPYKIFGSPEYIHKKIECSICGKTFIPWSDCEHIQGKVYDGEMCYGIVKDMDVISISLVTKPNQKYSVIFDDVDDPCRYPTLEYLVPKLKSKYSRWDFKVTNRYEPYSKYKAKKEDLCPCHSGEKFKDCCRRNGKGIKYPHYEFILPY